MDVLKSNFMSVSSFFFFKTIAAIYGNNFCWSASRAFQMLSNNALRVIAINSVGDFILFLGKAGVSSNYNGNLSKGYVTCNKFETVPFFRLSPLSSSSESN